MTDSSDFLISTRKLLQYYKSLAEKTFDQLDDIQINWKPNEQSNSVALIVHHLSGNMLSRFTDFLTSDGEKPWRNREAEFEIGYPNKNAMLESWNKGWDAVFSAINSVRPDQLSQVIYIRNEGHTVMDALQRQLAHYPHHIGQIVFIGKMLKGHEWTSLSIPKGASSAFNQDKFSQEKQIRHFTDRT